MQMHHLDLSWDEFYKEPGVPASSFYKKQFGTTKTVSEESQYVAYCMFVDCSATKGGGILIESKTILLIEETSFSSCQATSGNGGGLYFNAQGSSTLSKICSFKCRATNQAQFCYVEFSMERLHNIMLR